MQVSYSITDLTNQDVIVAITSNEPMQAVDGWTLSENKLSMTKKYEENNTHDLKVYDLAGNETTVVIDIQNIDKIKPVVMITNITNSNMAHPEVANKDKTITVTVKVTDNIEINKTSNDAIIAYVDSSTGTKIYPSNVKVVDSSKKEINLILEFKNLKSNGNFYLSLDNGFGIDKAGNLSELVNATDIVKLDNISPKITYSQQVLSNGKVRVTLTADEPIEQKDGWTISEDSKSLTKEFVSNTSYDITLYDYAGNETTTTINITGATFITLIYASHNSEVGWTYRVWEQGCGRKSSSSEK